MAKKKDKKVEERATVTPSVHPKDPTLARLFGIGSVSESGVVVNENTIFNSSAVFAAINLLSGSFGTMPIQVFKQTQENGQLVTEEQHFSPESKVLGWAANSYMTPMTFFSTLLQHCLTHGNGYAEIEATKGFDLINFWPVTPDRCEPVLDKAGELRYEVDVDGKPNYIKPEKMIHVPGMGWDGYKGYSILQNAKNSIGLTLATEKHANKTLNNSAIPKGVLSTTQTLNDKTYKRLAEKWGDRHEGLDNTARVAILEAGLEYKGITMTASDIELLGTRKFQVSEVARWFNVPPHMLRELGNATYGTVKEQSEEYIEYSLMPWIIRFEQEINKKVFMPKWTKNVRYFCKFNFEVFLRPDILTRYKAYQTGIAGGFLNPDEPRAKEGLNVIPDGKGKEFLRPMNMTTAGQPNDNPGK